MCKTESNIQSRYKSSVNRQKKNRYIFIISFFSQREQIDALVFNNFAEIDNIIIKQIETSIIISP